MGDGDAYPLELRRYVARFDRGEYWLAHEEMEEHWQVDRRDPFKGLIQIAAAFLHIERRNWRGAQRLLRTALDYLTDVPDRFEGFDVGTIRVKAADVLSQVNRLADGEDGRFDDSLRFQMAPLFAAEISDGIVEDTELPYRVRRYEEGYRPVREQRAVASGRGKDPESGEL